MRRDLPALGGLIRDSVAEPRAVARHLLSLDLPRRTAVELAVLVSALGALLVGLVGGGGMTLPMGESEVVVSPLGYALALVVSLLVSALAIALAGRSLGGTGTFDQALSVIVWVEVVALVVRVIQLLVVLILPLAAPVVGLLGLAVLLWTLINFVRVLHGFDGFGRAVLTLLLGGLGVGIAFSLVIAALGGMGGPSA